MRRKVPLLTFACIVLCSAASLCSCGKSKEEKVVTPWGEVTDTIPSGDSFDLDQIVANGEIIVATISGPTTYYDLSLIHI